jgi:hypothetical protein
MASPHSQESPERSVTETSISAAENIAAEACDDGRIVVAGTISRRDNSNCRNGDGHSLSNGVRHDRRRITHILVREN